jgi:hypothetical protein
MQTTEIAFEIDREKVKRILARFALPDEIERLATKYGEDHTGDSSVFLTFYVKDDAKIGPEDVKRLSTFLAAITSALLNEGIGGFAYTRLEQAA